MASNQQLIRTVRRELAAAGDPRKAPQMQAYMKSELPFLGVLTPQRRQIARRAAKAHRLATFDALWDTVMKLWRDAHYREERYVALDLLGLREHDGFQTMAALPCYEEMIESGAWWDFVDEIAHRLRRLLEKYPRAMTRRMLAWSRGRHLWKRRAAILCQLQRKDETDLELLYGCIEPNKASSEFFLRKAIGWALRDYAWTNPEEVRRYVTHQGEALSGLTRREALKNVRKDIVG